VCGELLIPAISNSLQTGAPWRVVSAGAQIGRARAASLLAAKRYLTKNRNFATTRVGRRGGRRSGDHRDLTGVLTKHVEEVDHLAANIAARFDF